MHARGPRFELAWVAALATLAAPTAQAQPVVRVRAETRIELRVERSPDRVTFEGTLWDDRGDPLPGRPVDVRVAELDGLARGHQGARTDSRGHFTTTFPLEPGTYRVEAHFEGEDRYHRVDVVQTLDLSRAHVRLSMSVPNGGRLDLLNLDERDHSIAVSAQSEEGGAGLSVELSNEVGERLAVGTTGADGSCTLTIESASLGAPATGRLVVHTPGDARRAAAQTEVLVVRYRPTRLTLDASPRRARADEPVHVEVELSDSAGPLGREAVGLFAGEDHLETVLTDERGRIERDVSLGAEDGEPVILSARFLSDAPWRPASRSEPIAIEIEVRGATPWEWLLLPMGICAALVWWVQRRASSVPAARTREPARPAPPGIVASGAKARLEDRRDVSGQVLDADEGHALAGGTVTLGELSASTDVDGRFTFVDVPDGEHGLRVNAEGYETRDAAVRVPHRGPWSSATVRLRSFRQLAIIAYRPVAEALVPSPRWWAFWTPRELLERARREQRAQVEEITDAIELAAYDAKLPTLDDVDAIDERAARLKNDPRPPPSP